MKKIIIAFLAITMAASIAGCGKKTETAEDYADKLVSGEIQPDVDVKERKDTEAPSAEAENQSAEKDINSEDEKAVEIEIPIAELARIVDNADNEYKSFEIQDISSNDFFYGKNLRLVAALKDHEMTYLYEQNITASFKDRIVTMTYTDKDNKQQEIKNLIYAMPEHPVESTEGRKFSVVAFGDHELTNENKTFSTDCLALIKMRDDVDMKDAKADTYVLLIESAIEGQYEIFKVEG